MTSAATSAGTTSTASIRMNTPRRAMRPVTKMPMDSRIAIMAVSFLALRARPPRGSPERPRLASHLVAHRAVVEVERRLAVARAARSALLHRRVRDGGPARDRRAPEDAELLRVAPDAGRLRR